VNSGKFTDLEKSQLRLTLKYEKRMELFSSMKDTGDCQEFIIKKDFILLCNNLFYHTKNDANLILKTLMAH